MGGLKKKPILLRRCWGFELLLAQQAPLPTELFPHPGHIHFCLQPLGSCRGHGKSPLSSCTWESESGEVCIWLDLEFLVGTLRTLPPSPQPVSLIPLTVAGAISLQIGNFSGLRILKFHWDRSRGWVSFHLLT